MPTALDLRDIPTSTRAKTQASDFAGKNKSFPILKPVDVAAAAKSIGRAGSDNYPSDKLKANIIRIAKRKGAAFVAQLPKAWRGSPAKDASLAPFVSLIHLGQGDNAQQSWAQLLRTGDFYDPRYGDFTITQADLATMAGNFATKYPKDPTKLAIDYNHGTSRPATPEEGKAAGWITDVQLRAGGDELWGLVEWTETAASMIASKEYQFVSATFSFDYTNSNGGEAIGPTLLAAAVTNRPVVHGMAALALAQAGAVHLDATGDDADEEAEALFSFDEIRRRVQAALTDAFGMPTGYVSSYDTPFRGVYLEALFDGYLIYCEYDGDKFRVDYSVAEDGSVSFTSEPVEVRVSYEPLTAPDAEEQTMSKVTFKNAKGEEQSLELAQEAIDAVVKAHAPKPAAEPVELKATVEKQGSTIVELQAQTKSLLEQNAALELAAKTRDAEADFNTLFLAGKVNAAEKPALMKLALADKAMFTELMATRPVIREVGVAHGSGSDITASTDQAALDLAIADVMKAEPKLTKEQAYAKALDRNPTLYKG